MAQADRTRLQQAIALHQQGNLALAELLYRGLLAEHPQDAQVLGLLGLVEAAKGETDSAIDLLRRCVQLDATQAPAQFNLGLLLQEKGLDEEALACFRQVTTLRPDMAPAHNGCGMALKRLGRHAQALQAYQTAVQLAPDFAEAWNNLGVVLRLLGRFDEAAQAFRRALAIKPHLAEVHTNLGRALHDAGAFDQALQAFESARRMQPESADAAMNVGVTLNELKRFDEALVVLGEAAALDPSNADVQLNVGNVLADLNRHEEALACFDAVLARCADDVDALMNKANVLRDMHRGAQALPLYERALATGKRQVEVQWNQALCLLASGDFERGWEAFEARRRSEAMADLSRVFDAPPWAPGEPVSGRRIFVHAEQGLGDTIQFARFAPELAKRGASVTLEVQRSLVPVLASLSPAAPGDAARAALTSAAAPALRVIARGEDPGPYDLHVPLLSLPGRLGIRTHDIPAAQGYLRPDPARVARWSPLIQAQPGLHVGIAWSGNAAYRNDHRRSIALAQLLRALPPGASCWVLQKDVALADEAVLAGAQNVRRFAENDFAHTAAQAACLDVIVSVDTSIAHLAAALGRPTWLLLSYTADWRWMWDRTDSPWYAGVRLFRQPRPGDWDGALGPLSDALSALAASKRA